MGAVLFPSCSRQNGDYLTWINLHMAWSSWREVLSVLLKFLVSHMVQIHNRTQPILSQKNTASILSYMHWDCVCLLPFCFIFIRSKLCAILPYIHWGGKIGDEEACIGMQCIGQAIHTSSMGLHGSCNFPFRTCSQTIFIGDDTLIKIVKLKHKLSSFTAVIKTQFDRFWWVECVHVVIYTVNILYS